MPVVVFGFAVPLAVAAHHCRLLNKGFCSDVWKSDVRQVATTLWAREGGWICLAFTSTMHPVVTLLAQRVSTWAHNNRIHVWVEAYAAQQNAGDLGEEMVPIQR